MTTPEETLVQEKIRIRFILLGAVGIFLLFLSIGLVFSYAVPGRLGESVRKVSFFPVAVVDTTSVISFSELSRNLSSVRRFYENQDLSEYGIRIDFSTDDGKNRLKIREKELLNKLIEDRAAEILLKEKGLVVTNAMARDGVRRQLDEFGSEDQVKNELDRLYGWSIDDFEEKIVRPALYQEELSKIFEKESDVSRRARENIHTVSTLLQSGTDFASLAVQYSEGKTAQNGGKLGWFALSDLAPELREAVQNARPYVPTEVLESSLGFHILLVRSTKEEDGKMFYDIDQIFTRKPVYADWLSDQMKGMKIWILDTDYNWNRETSRVEFRDASLREYESNLLKNNPGEAAFFL